MSKACPQFILHLYTHFHEIQAMKYPYCGLKLVGGYKYYFLLFILNIKSQIRQISRERFSPSV